MMATRYCDVCGTDNYRHQPDCDVVSECTCGMNDCRACMKRPGAVNPFPRERVVYASLHDGPPW